MTTTGRFNLTRGLRQGLIAGGLALFATGAGAQDSNSLTAAVEAAPINTLTPYTPANGMSSSNFQSQSGNVGSYLTYMGTTQWDPARNAFHIIGKNYGGGTQWVHGRFDANTDSYEIVSRSGGSLLPGAATFGHMYEGVAVDPNTGTVYHNGLDQDNVGRYNPTSGSWSNISGGSIGSTPTPVLKYHGARDELVFVKSGSTNLRVWDGSSWSTGGTIAWSGNVSHHAVGSYNPVREYVLFGGGDNANGGGGSNRMFVYDSAGNVRRIADAPTGFSVEDGALFMVDYATGDDLIIKWQGGWNRTIYRLHSNETWTTEQITGTLPGEYGASAVTIHEYNANVLIDYNRGNPRFLIYKTGDGSSVPPPPPPPPPPTPTVQLDANPTSVAAGSSTTLSWSSSQADSCQASGGWSGPKSTDDSETVGPLTGQTTFDLECTNNQGGTASASVTVSVQITPPPTVNFDANPNSVTSGDFSQLSWDTSNATTCTGRNGWTGNKPTMGSESVGPLTADTTYRLECDGDGGTTSRSVTVQVVAPGQPSLSFSADDNQVPSNSMGLLNWNATNADSCDGSGGWSGDKPLSGNESVGPITTDTTYTLTCSGAGGTTNRSVTITVESTPGSPPTNNDASEEAGALGWFFLWLLSAALVCGRKQRSNRRL